MRRVAAVFWSLLLGFALAEGAARVWLTRFADEDAFRRYASIEMLRESFRKFGKKFPIFQCSADAIPLGDGEVDAVFAIRFLFHLDGPGRASVLEEMAHRLETVTVHAGDVVVREGDVADRFYVIAEGEVQVSHGDLVVRREGAGDFFGEIGLLRNVPRTATVTALTDSKLWTLERADFLGAITGTGAARVAAEDVVSRRIAT